MQQQYSSDSGVNDKAWMTQVLFLLAPRFKTYVSRAADVAFCYILKIVPRMVWTIQSPRSHKRAIAFLLSHITRKVNPLEIEKKYCDQAKQSLLFCVLEKRNHEKSLFTVITC